jgi:signal transduction histidine kinase
MNKKNRVLIVEDELLNIEFYKEMLGDRYDLSIAENGEKSLKIMEKNPPDIVLLDVMLPDHDGIDLCKTFKSSKWLVHIPIIIVTTLDSPEDKIKALEAGANDFLTKPVDKTELLLKIQNHLTILEQYKQIKKQNDEINKYVEVIVHDLNNPLAVIIGYIGLIESYIEDPLTREYISKVIINAQGMRDSINEILDIHKILRSSFNINLEQFNLIQRIEEISSEWGILAGKKRINISLSLDPGVPYVIGDRGKFKDVIGNLVSNALKYSPPDTTIDIVTKYLSNGFVKIIIRDQGLGLTEEDKKKVFLSFQKLSSKPTGSETSTGLGLSIVKRLVELMGGEVGAESAGKNKGSSFWFTLPHEPT